MGLLIKKADKANTRVGGGNKGGKREQNFELRFRKFLTKKTGDESRYYISDKVWDALGLENKGLDFYEIRENENSPVTAVWFGVIDAENSTLLRKSSKNEGDKKKGRNFKSTVLDKWLAEAGVIDLSESAHGKNQLLKFVEVSHEGGSYLNLVKDTEGQAKFDSDEKAEAEMATGQPVTNAGSVATEEADETDL